VLWFSTGILLVDPSRKPAQIQERLFEAAPDFLSFLWLHHGRCFPPFPLRTPRQLCQEREVAEESIRGADLHGVRFLELTLSAEEKLRALQDPPAHVPRSVAPRPVQITDLAAREVVLRDGLGQDLAVLPLAPGQRH
jgi:hypothetical protein